MAILKGFPPSNTISPSVRITEKDLSFIAPEQTLHTGALVGFASKGPVNLPTLISTSTQLHRTFGQPHPDVGDPYLTYAADQYLLVANQVYIIRVAELDPVSDAEATEASVDVPSAGGVVQVIGSVGYANDESETVTVDNDKFFRYRLNGVLMPKTLVLNDTDGDPLGIGTEYTIQEIVNWFNDQLTSEDGIEFFKYDDGIDDFLGVRTLWAYGPDATLEFVSIQDALYGPQSTATVGLGIDMEPAQALGANTYYDNTGYPVAGEYDLGGLSGLTLNIVVDGTDNVLIDNVVQVVDLDAALVTLADDTTITDIVTAINQYRDDNLPGGWQAVDDSNALRIETLATGKDSRLRIKADSTALDIFGFDSLTKKGISPSRDSDAVDVHVAGVISGTLNTTGEVTFTVKADSVGIDGNTTQIKITNDVNANVFTFEVYNDGVQVESWGNLTKDTTSRFYVESYLTLVSDYVRVSDDTDINAGPANGTYNLSGGSDGIPADPDDQDALLIGSKIGSTGLYTLSDTEQIDIDLVAIPGHASTTCVTALIDFCQNVRTDCLAIIDPPFGLTIKEIIAWQNGSHPLNTTKLDTDFAALYWPWVKIRDNYNQVDVWVPPSGSVMATIARSDSIARPWFAPAGITRGIVPGITDVYDRPNLEERDLLYGNRNCVNPIVSFPDIGGFLVFGQKTLQRRPTALDRVNVRRMMFYVEKRIRSASRILLFEPNDTIFRNRFILLAKSILDEVKVGRGITDFIIKADAELNTPDVIDRNEFRARIGIQPTRAVEFMFIEFSIHRTGSFAENADTF